MGTVTERAGAWRAQVRRHGRSESATFAAKRDALVWIEKTEAQIICDAAPPPQPTRRLAGSFAVLLDRYERECYPLKRWGVSKAYELSQLRKDLGSEPLAGLTQERIVRYSLELRQRMAGAGVRNRLSYITEVFKAAEDLWGAATPRAEIERAIAGLSRQKVLARSKPRTRRPGDDEIDSIASYCKASKKMEVDLPAVLAVLRLVPLRVGELVAIRWEDLRPTERAVVIRNRKHPDVTQKTGNDYVVPLPVLDGIDTYPLIAERPRYLARPFPWARGIVSSAFWVAAKGAGVSDLHLHDLRALAISRLLEAGIPIPLVAHLSGHRNWKVLQRHYARITPAAIHEAIARIAA